MQYHVPQFLEVEDKLFGFLTLKQFLYLLGGGAISYLAYTYITFFLAFPIIIFMISFSVALAFYRPNNKPFMDMAEAMFNYSSSPRLYIWKKTPKTPKEKEKEKEAPVGMFVPALSESNLKDLAWSLDIKEHDVIKTQSKREIPLLKDL